MDRRWWFAIFIFVVIVAVIVMIRSQEEPEVQEVISIPIPMNYLDQGEPEGPFIIPVEFAPPAETDGADQPIISTVAPEPIMQVSGTSPHTDHTDIPGNPALSGGAVSALSGPRGPTAVRDDVADDGGSADILIDIPGDAGGVAPGDMYRGPITGRMKNSMYFTETKSSLLGCRKNCDDDSTCQVFSYKPGTNACFLAKGYLPMSLEKEGTNWQTYVRQ